MQPVEPPDLPRTNAGAWLTKPDGMKYAGFLDSAVKLVDPSAMGLWQRQMTLGPGNEFCLLGAPHSAPSGMLNVGQVPLRPVWPAAK